MKLTVTAVILMMILNAGTFARGSRPGPGIIPQPVEIRYRPGKFLFRATSRIMLISPDTGTFEVGQYLADRLRACSGMQLLVKTTPGKPENGSVILKLGKYKKLGNEGYRLTASRRQVQIEANTDDGLFYGVQSLFQLMPGQVYSSVPAADVKWSVPAVRVLDYPRYSWRGMHLDVSRHFFNAEFVKKYIDFLAMHKMNVFHWHLTDDNGWRIEIKKYPLLTKVGAWRVDREAQPWTAWDSIRPGEQATCGGYYTQDQVREVVEYARKRHIRVVPEIEMPAHCVAALAAYPQFSCSGGPFHVMPGSYWPDYEIFCAGNDSTFTFLQDILSEVADLFPSAYIHIGGDEADKARWKSCPKCQARILSEGLKNEAELQSYFVKRIEKFLLTKGKKLIGWDEILEGGLAPEATVMSWRGTDGGIAAARMGHDVIMCPGTHCYFDYYQADPEFQPKAIGGFTSLRKVYSFEPTPPGLKPAEATHVLGGQANLWAEYIKTPSHAEYMVLPRMSALAEALWTPKSGRDWTSFQHRIAGQMERFSAIPAAFCKGSFKADIRVSEVSSRKHRALVTLDKEVLEGKIFYTTDSSVPSPSSNLYTGPFFLKNSALIRAAVIVDGRLMEKPNEQQILFHKALGIRPIFKNPFSDRYPAGGATALSNGILGGEAHNDGSWQGFLGDDLEVVFDLKKMQTLTHFSVNFLQNYDAWIFFPRSVEFAVSEDGHNYQVIDVRTTTLPVDRKGRLKQAYSATVPGVNARFVRVHAVSRKVCPEGHPGAGEKCWLFADEVVMQ